MTAEEVSFLLTSSNWILCAQNNLDYLLTKWLKMFLS